MRLTWTRWTAFLIVLLSVLILPSVLLAQDSTSAALAAELTALLDKNKLDAIAAKDPSAPDLYVAALYFQGSQLLVASARYSAPSILNEKLAKKDYREVYTDLNSASVPGSLVLVMDMGANGLQPKREETRVDTCDMGSKSLLFDGDWKRMQMASEADYSKAFADADARYAKMLAALIAQAKKM
jgi:hypothetical protein